MMQTAPRINSPMAHADVIAEFSRFLVDCGLVDRVDFPITADQPFQRFTLKGDKPSNKAGWYCLHADGVPNGVCGSWKTGKEYKWNSRSLSTLSVPDRKQELERRSRQKQQRREKADEERRVAAQECRDKWDRAKPTAQHDYLERKNVQSYGLKICGSMLLIPMYNAAGILVNLQMIQPDGGKQFTYRAQTSGAFFMLGRPESKLYIAEGYATAATIYEATGTAVAVAFSSPNLSKVVTILKESHSDLDLIIAADNDRDKQINAGLLAAKKIARDEGIDFVFPTFENGQAGSDFNDLASAQGIQSVARQLTQNGGDGAMDANVVDIDRANPDFDYRQFDVRADGVWAWTETRQRFVKISSLITIEAVTCHKVTGDYGRLLSWTDPDENRQQRIVPMEFLAGDGLQMRRLLLAGGAVIEPTRQKRELFMAYMSQTVDNRVSHVSKTGWCDKNFVLPDQTIGEDDIVFQSETGERNLYACRGSIEQWNLKIGFYCQGNTRLMFSVSMGFAAPLLHLASLEGISFNLLGRSSQGKTTALKAAASVCGDSNYMRSWRTTDNGLEAVAEAHNDTLLVLDEMGQIDDPAKAGAISYMLANGHGKSRARREGNSAPTRTWRVLVLSSGERSLADLARNEGQSVTAGQVLRVADIPIDTGVHGGFENLHNFSTGKELSEYLSQACESSESSYGVPLRAFMKEVIANPGYVKQKIKQYKEMFESRFVPLAADTQVNRIASYFALVAAAGELATEFNIANWESGQSLESAGACFRAHLEQRGGVGNMEDFHVIGQVANFLCENQSRFALPADSPSSLRESEPIGYKVRGTAGLEENENGFFLEMNIFRNRVCLGLDQRFVLKTLKSNGYLVTEQGRNSISRRFSGASVRGVLVKASILDTISASFE